MQFLSDSRQAGVGGNFGFLQTGREFFLGRLVLFREIFAVCQGFTGFLRGLALLNVELLLLSPVFLPISVFHLRLRTIPESACSIA